MKNVAGSGAKWLDVSAERFPGWISSFARRHGDPAVLGMRLDAGSATFTAADGATAECHPPFAESFAWPARSSPAGETVRADIGDDEGPVTAAIAVIAAHAQVPRAVGVLLVRLGGYAAGVFTGYPPVLADAKVGSRLVHGRSAAGGWSQHRFARRREKQASEALDAASGTAVAVFGRWEAGITASGAPAPGGTAPAPKGAAPAPGRRRLDAVVLGGDKRTAAELRDDPRLAPYLALATGRFLTVPDPKRAVLESTPKLFTAVRIRITEPSS